VNWSGNLNERLCEEVGGEGHDVIGQVGDDHLNDPKKRRMSQLGGTAYQNLEVILR